MRTNRSLNLQGYDGLELRVRGGGRTFEVGVQDDLRRRGRLVSRRAPFKTQQEWTWVTVPFNSLRPTIFGQPVSAPDIDLSSVISLSLFIVDGQDGPFRLEVDSIRAYKKSKK